VNNAVLLVPSVGTQIAFIDGCDVFRLTQITCRKEMNVLPNSLHAWRRTGGGVFYTTRSKLVSSFLMVALLVGVVSIYTGRQVLHSTVLRQTESRVSLDLNAASRIYQGEIDTIAAAINTASLDKEFLRLISRIERRKLGLMMRAVAQSNALDFAGVASADGAIIVGQVRDAPAENNGGTKASYRPRIHL